MKNIKKMHRAAGFLALLLIFTFLISTIITEFIGDYKLIGLTKKYILISIAGLILLMAATGLSGFRMTKKRDNIITRRKKSRIKIIGINGILLSIFAAILYYKSSNAQYDNLFWTIQSLEIFFGTVNLILIILMIRDGMRLSGKI